MHSLKFMSITDRDIFELLMSSKQRLSEKALSEMFVQRGVLFSKETERYNLCQAISQIPHDRRSIVYMIESREAASRMEKRTFTKIPLELTAEEIDKAVLAYANGSGAGDFVTTQARRSNGSSFNVEYDEIDYSKTRLMQSQKRDVVVEIVSENGSTIIRTPANEKADTIVHHICKEVEKLRLMPIIREEISISELSAEKRTEFFIKLVRDISGYNYLTAVALKVAKETEDDEFIDEIDLESGSGSGQEILAKINKVALAGENILQTETYQSLLKSGFFLTAMTWTALQRDKPYDMLQFEASFRDGSAGTGFRFNAKIARRLKRTDEITKEFIPIAENRRPAIWKLIEEASQRALTNVKSQDGTQEA